MLGATQVVPGWHFYFRVLIRLTFFLFLYLYLGFEKQSFLIVTTSFSKALHFMQKLEKITLTLDIDILVYYYTQHLCWTERIGMGTRMGCTRLLFRVEFCNSFDKSIDFWEQNCHIMQMFRKPGAKACPIQTKRSRQICWLLLYLKRLVFFLVFRQ